MDTIFVAVGSFLGFIIAYHTYGRWLSQKIFNLDASAPVPSQQLRDDTDFIPTKKSVIFGHHFTSIAGTGPIVGPAIAVFWGWLPALIMSTSYVPPTLISKIGSSRAMTTIPTTAPMKRTMKGSMIEVMPETISRVCRS